MNHSTLTREMALRIGLAARELEAIDAAQLLKGTSKNAAFRRRSIIF